MTTMTFDQAVQIVKDYTGCGNLLLDGLEQIKAELREEDSFITRDAIRAYGVVCTEMRKLFF
jgi:hypothetical protein